jgi:hypothetical protein
MTLVALTVAGLVSATPAWAATSVTGVSVSFVKGDAGAVPRKGYEPVFVNQATVDKTTQYVISFTSPDAVPTDGSITVVAPPGTFFPGSGGQAQLVPTSSSLFGRVFVLATQVSADGSTLTAFLGGGVFPEILRGDTDNLIIEGRTPSTPGLYTVTVSTSADPAPATSAPYTIVAKGSPEAPTAKWACLKDPSGHGYASFGHCVSGLASTSRGNRPPRR